MTRKEETWVRKPTIWRSKVNWRERRAQEDGYERSNVGRKGLRQGTNERKAAWKENNKGGKVLRN